MNKFAGSQKLIQLARDIIVGYYPTTLSEIFGAGEIVKHHQLTKLIIEIKATVPGSSTVTEDICSTVCSVYKLCHQLSKNVDVRINVESLKIETPPDKQIPADIIFVTEGSDFSLASQNVVTLPKLEKNVITPSKSLPRFGNVVLGGTFDRLHAGHKILLTEAVLRCEKKLTVGVTDVSMIQSKTLWELIEPVEDRILKVLQFLKDVDGTLDYDVVSISDMYGPTRHDPELEMLVVSIETARGGQKVNEARKENNLSPLAIHVVPLVEDLVKGVADEEKISSSNERRGLLGSILRPPQPNPNLPNRPYLIGLTGGIASGKSNIGENLKRKGAGLIDCDKVAHMLYRKGTATYKDVIKIFGKSIVGSDGEIDRRALGSIVFNSRDELENLNNLLWPAILEASLAEANRLYREDKVEVVVLEAAVLLRAGWHKSVHQVWTSIIPPQEAVQRIINRNGLDESAAQARVNAQPSNSEQVAIANVVFSTLYSYEFTALQVDRAWNNLSEYLERGKTATCSL